MASADLPCGSDLGEVGSHAGPNGTQMQKFDLNLIDAQEDSTFIEFFTFPVIEHYIYPIPQPKTISSIYYTKNQPHSSCC